MTRAEARKLKPGDKVIHTSQGRKEQLVIDYIIVNNDSTVRIEDVNMDVTETNVLNLSIAV